MATAQAIIEAAYARRTSFDPGKLASNVELINRLQRAFAPLYRMAARQRPDEFESTALVTLFGTPGASTLATAVPSLTDVIDIRRVRGYSGSIAAGVKVHLATSPESIRTYQLAPTVFRRGLSIVSRGAAGDPVAPDVLELFVLDTPAALTALTSVLDGRFPAAHHDLFVTDLAIYLDIKDSGQAGGALIAERRGQMMMFAQEYNLSASVVEAIFVDRVPVPIEGSA